MINRASIAQWRTQAPWNTSEQVEQDLIICRALIAIFSDEFLASQLAFRGGTALHKLYLAPQRRYSYQKDLDIGIDREYLGFGGELSKTQISDKLRRASCTFSREVLTVELKKQLLGVGIDESLFSINVNISSVTTTDPEIIEIHYKTDYDKDAYIPNRVLIEVSGRSHIPIHPLPTKILKSMLCLPSVPFWKRHFFCTKSFVNQKVRFVLTECLAIFMIWKNWQKQKLRKMP